MGKRKKFAKRLQKALNHINKTIIRLDELDEMEDSKILITNHGETGRTIWWFLGEEVRGIRRRILFSADGRGIALDEEGMPR